jgi:Tol biopolymer transport system component
MPDIQEVFRMATQKVRPDPAALERQHARERRHVLRQKIPVYALVAALVIAGVVIAISRLAGNGPETPLGHPSGAVSGSQTGEPQAVVVGLDGIARATVPGIPPTTEGLSLSPDGTEVALSDGFTISTIGIDGTGLRDLSLPFAGAKPAWSPDGARIAFQGQHNGNSDIYVMDADGSNLRRLTKSPADDMTPSWAPDGSQILFTNAGGEPLDNNGYSSTSEIYTVPATGGTPTRLTDNRVDDSEASYSPDGTQIAFHREGGAWIMEADGSNTRALPLPGKCCTGFTPVWSPDGTKIAFTRYDPAWRYSGLAVVAPYVVDLSSGEVSAVGHVEMVTDNYAPQWLPSGDALLVYGLERP